MRGRTAAGEESRAGSALKRASGVLSVPIRGTRVLFAVEGDSVQVKATVVQGESREVGQERKLGKEREEPWL